MYNYQNSLSRNKYHKRKEHRVRRSRQNGVWERVVLMRHRSHMMTVINKKERRLADPVWLIIQLPPSPETWVAPEVMSTFASDLESPPPTDWAHCQLSPCRMWRFLICYLHHQKAQDKTHIFITVYLFIYLAALGLRCCARAFSSCGEQGLLSVAVHRLLLLRSTGSRLQ